MSISISRKAPGRERKKRGPVWEKRPPRLERKSWTATWQNPRRGIHVDAVDHVSVLERGRERM